MKECRRRWPGHAPDDSDSGVRNYSIYLAGDRVFGYYECDDPEGSKAYQAAQEVTKRWGAAMAPLFHPEVAEQGLQNLPEIFRLD